MILGGLKRSSSASSSSGGRGERGRGLGLVRGARAAAKRGRSGSEVTAAASHAPPRLPDDCMPGTASDPDPGALQEDTPLLDSSTPPDWLDAEVVGPPAPPIWMIIIGRLAAYCHLPLVTCLLPLA